MKAGMFALMHGYMHDGWVDGCIYMYSSLYAFPVYDDTKPYESTNSSH